MSRERAFNPHGTPDIERYGPPVAHSQQTPFNIYEALMRSRPHEEAEEAQEELLPLREVLQDAIDNLGERDRWVIDALVVRRISMRALARELGVTKSTIGRWRDKALRELRGVLASEPLVVGRLRK